MELAILSLEERRREDKEFACATRDLVYQDLPQKKAGGGENSGPPSR